MEKGREEGLSRIIGREWGVPRVRDRLSGGGHASIQATFSTECVWVVQADGELSGRAVEERGFIMDGTDPDRRIDRVSGRLRSVGRSVGRSMSRSLCVYVSQRTQSRRCTLCGGKTSRQVWLGQVGRRNRVGSGGGRFRRAASGEELLEEDGGRVVKLTTRLGAGGGGLRGVEGTDWTCKEKKGEAVFLGSRY